MKSNYKRLGEYIRLVDERNSLDKKENLLGVSVSKVFIESIANTVGTDFKTYKIVRKNQFTYIPDTSRRGDKIGVALLEDRDEGLVSQAYTVFEVIDEEQLLPQYLMMWFRRPEFDRYARYISHGSVREIFSWEDMCDVQLPVPSISKQKEIVDEYNVINNRIALNNEFIDKLNEATQTIYSKWFVEYEFPDVVGQPYKSNNNPMVFNANVEKNIPSCFEVKCLSEVCNIVYGKNLPTDKLMNKGYFVYGGNGIIGKYKEYLYDREQVIIACRGAASGKISVTYPKSFVTNNSIVFENSVDFEYRYLKYFCLNNSFQNYITGSAQPQITIENIKDIQVVWPSKSVMDNFNKIMAIFDNKIYLMEIENMNLNTLKELVHNKISILEVAG